MLNAGPAMSRWAQGTAVGELAQERRRRTGRRPSGPSRAGAGRRSCCCVTRSAISSGIGIGQCARRPRRRGHDRVDDVVGAHHAADPVAEREHHVAGQGGDVEDHVGLLLGGPDEGVGEDQPALGVGVQHLDGLAAVHREHVAWPGRPTPETMFSAIGANVETLTGSPSRGDRERRLDDGRGAGHVALHRAHAAGGLDRQAAGVERDALADQGEVGDRVRGGVGQLDQPRRRGRAAGRRRGCRRSRARRAPLVVDRDLTLGAASPWGGARRAAHGVGERGGVRSPGGVFTQSRVAATAAATTWASSKAAVPPACGRPG